MVGAGAGGESSAAFRRREKLVALAFSNAKMDVEEGLALAGGSEGSEPRQNDNLCFLMKSFLNVLYYKYYNLIL